MDAITQITPILGLVAMVLAMIVSYGTIHARKTDPQVAKDREQDDKIEKILRLLDNDNGRLNRLESSNIQTNEFQRMCLRTMKGMLQHLRSGNHTEQMEALEGEIDDFLIGGSKS
ncbi:hypothetical protein LQZ18_18355 [Lachnospiraceae bacterium ZAX-1]